MNWKKFELEMPIFSGTELEILQKEVMFAIEEGYTAKHIINQTWFEMKNLFLKEKKSSDDFIEKMWDMYKYPAYYGSETL